MKTETDDLCTTTSGVSYFTVFIFTEVCHHISDHINCRSFYQIL